MSQNKHFVVCSINISWKCIRMDPSKRTWTQCVFRIFFNFLPLLTDLVSKKSIYNSCYEVQNFVKFFWRNTLILNHPKFSRDISTIFLLQLKDLLCLNRNWMKIRMLLQKGSPSIVFFKITVAYLLLHTMKIFNLDHIAFYYYKDFLF